MSERPVSDEKQATTDRVVSKDSSGTAADIIKEKSENEILRENKERWASALECSGNGVWDWDAATGKVIFSREWKMMLGYDEDEIGDSLEEWEGRLHPYDRNKTMEELQKHFDGLTPMYQSEHRLRSMVGSYKWVLDRGKVLERDENGKVLRIIGTHTDITDLQETQEGLSRTRSLLKAILDNLPFLAWFKDIEGNHIEVNRVFEKACGLSREEIIGKTSLDIWPLDLAMKLIANDNEVIANRKQINKEEQLDDKNGGEWYSFFRTPLFNEEGEVVGTTGIARDVTESRKLRHELIAQRTFLKSLIDAIPDLIFYKDKDSVYLGCNNAFAHRFIGLDEEEIVGRTDLEVVRDKEMARRFRQQDREVMAARKTGMVEETIVLADGSNLAVETMKTPFYNEQGELVGLIGVSRDITKRKIAQDQLLIKQKMLANITAATNELLVNSDCYGAIAKCLVLLGEATGVDRVYMFDNYYEGDKGYSSQKMEWNSGNFSNGIDKFRTQAISFEEARGFLEPLLRGQAINGLVKEFTDNWTKEVFESQNIQSILILPIMIEQHFWGFVGFDECKNER
ncbi:MAG: PAS domain-containing protein, partial [Syntrophomonas sp.]